MEIGLVRQVDIDREMQQAYLDYAMSVIVARALPDARDGLKPVHRRILYAMLELGLRPDSAYKKSARIVGEVLGKFHPHGDMAVYEAMARMAQPFTLRVPLVDGQGNFGSVDGDPPAAMRYTEARLTAAAMQLLADIDKDTVDFAPNFDDTLREPTVLPAAFPNLLVNGATGIAVGMSTSIPPHNLAEVIDALRYLLLNWEKIEDITIEDLMQFIQGPDFPTGGILLAAEGEHSLASAYGSGRGQVVVRARAHLEEMERGRSRIIVTELPYTVNKAALIERIAELVREEKLSGITDLRDESDQRGMRIVIEVGKNADPEGVLGELYRHTPMQSAFSIILLALVEGEPRLMSLKQVLRVYLDHRLTVIRRRSEYELRRARERAHILEGLRVALKNLDEVIELIRKSPDAETARGRLMRRFKLSELQAQAILDMPLRRLAALERKKIELEYQELLKRIKELESLLKSPPKLRALAAEELAAVKETFAERRRTQIVGSPAKGRPTALTVTDLTPAEETWISLTAQGLIWRSEGGKPPRLSGNEAPAWLLKASSRDTLYLVAENGECAALAVHSLPAAQRPAEGLPVGDVSPFKEGQPLAAMFALPPKGERPKEAFVLTVTRQGYVKKSSLEEVSGPAAHLFPLAKIKPGDRLGWVHLTKGDQEILLATAQGMAIRFSEQSVRPMGLAAAGVLGIKLSQGDQVIGAAVLPKTGDVLLVASDGRAKRLAIEQFPLQGRYGQGVQAWKLGQTARLIGLAVGKATAQATLFPEKLAPKSLRFDEAPLQTRAGRGKVVQELKAGDRLMRLVVAWEGWEATPAPESARSRRPARAKQPSAQPQPLPLPSEGEQRPARKSRSAPASSTPSPSRRCSKTKPEPQDE
ncbi:MAG: DNA gyrase subunit A [Anaerolineae bacterium]|jgi:DNA gyrase subunit A|nr:MAG: DNA gyrase subunit A [Anaerolineae bacterium]